MQGKIKPGWIDRMLLTLSPKKAYERAAYALACRGVYTAGDRGRLSEGWTTLNQTPEATNKMDRDIVRARARDQERNVDMFNSIISALERNVINTGIRLQAKILTDSAEREEDDELNRQIEELWQEWCRPGNCDVTGRFSFAKIQKMIVRRKFVDGGILVLKVYAGGMFRLQLVEVDCLDSSVLYQGNNQVIGGVEVDPYNRPVAYHIRQQEECGWAKTIRVPAERVIYIANITRPGQIREFSPAASSMVRIDEVNELIESSIMRERVLSYFSLVIKNSVASGGIGRGFAVPVSRSGHPEEQLEQGTIMRLNPGEEVQTINPNGNSSTISDVSRMTQRMSGSSVGLSYETTSRDMSQVNYSSARQGLLEDQRTYQDWQAEIMEMCSNIYEEWLDWMALQNRLPVSLRQYLIDRRKYQRHIWVTSGWDWIDPLKEASANRIALETHQKTLQEICASKGQDWRDILAQRKRELEIIQDISSVRSVEDGNEQDGGSGDQNTGD